MNDVNKILLDGYGCCCHISNTSIKPSRMRSILSADSSIGNGGDCVPPVQRPGRPALILRINHYGPDTNSVFVKVTPSSESVALVITVPASLEMVSVVAVVVPWFLSAMYNRARASLIVGVAVGTP